MHIKDTTTRERKRFFGRLERNCFLKINVLWGNLSGTGLISGGQHAAQTTQRRIGLGGSGWGGAMKTNLVPQSLERQSLIAMDSPCRYGGASGCRYPEEADAQTLRVAVLLDELDFPGVGQPDPRTGSIVVELKTANALPLLRYSCSSRVISLPTAQLNARRCASSGFPFRCSRIYQFQWGALSPQNLVWCSFLPVV